jgi:hypothetical protein
MPWTDWSDVHLFLIRFSGSLCSALARKRGGEGDEKGGGKGREVPMIAGEFTVYRQYEMLSTSTSRSTSTHTYYTIPHYHKCPKQNML